jgi:hypothetical protein
MAEDHPPFRDQERLKRRALRRHQRLRMIVRARHSLVLLGIEEPALTRLALRCHDHLKGCSCWMCGNPRKWRGDPTVQERRRLASDPFGERD